MVVTRYINKKMPNIKTTSEIKAIDFIKKANHAASYYGFQPLEKMLAKKGKDRLKVRNEEEVIKRSDPFGCEMADIIKTYITHNSKPTEPTFLYKSRIIEPSRSKNNKKTIRFGLSILGVEKSIGEALILKTALAILDDIGFKENCIHINSIGDKDSAGVFTRELQVYLRKHINDLPSGYREALKKSAFHGFEYLLNKQHPAHKEIPRSMEFLSDKSRKHLREVIEFLEAVDVPYEIDNRLIGNKECYSQTLFDIRPVLSGEQQDKNYEDEILAQGGRCDEISYQMFRQKVPAVGIMFEYSKGGVNNSILKHKTLNRKPKVYFIQLGAEAKLHSLPIIEMLRKSGIPISQSISRNTLSTQLEIARENKIPHTIIMGQREVIDGTVIIRNMNTQSQNTVPIISLSDYIKKMKVR